MHLSKLRAAGIVRVRAQGRNRYYELARADVARAVEALASLAPARSAKATQPLSDLEKGRTCYDHLAGQLGVRITEALVARGWILLRRGTYYSVESAGFAGFAALGIDIAAIRPKTRRRFAVPCIDWSERRPHLAGALGAAVAARFFALKWVARSRTHRVVRITVRGRIALQGRLGVEAPYPT
jgi:hypothetical protein